MQQTHKRPTQRTLCTVTICEQTNSVNLRLRTIFFMLPFYSSAVRSYHKRRTQETEIKKLLSSECPSIVIKAVDFFRGKNFKNSRVIRAKKMQNSRRRVFPNITGTHAH